MPQQARIVSPGPNDRTVRTADGEILEPPAGWALLPPGDATLTRRVKAAGPTWTVQERRGRKVFSRGVWAAAAIVEAVRTELEAERASDVPPGSPRSPSRRTWLMADQFSPGASSTGPESGPGQEPVRC